MLSIRIRCQVLCHYVLVADVDVADARVELSPLEMHGWWIPPQHAVDASAVAALSSRATAPPPP